MTDRSVAIVGGRVVPITGEPVDGGTVLVEDGRIVAGVTVERVRCVQRAVILKIAFVNTG